MIVVSNTSPLTNLASIGQFGLLRKLYSQIHIADGVWDELNAYDQRWPGCDEVASASWVCQHPVKNHPMVNILRRDLDRGESESIVLAEELGADMILLDEKEGRHAAQRLGLKVVGVMGVLLEAKSHGYLDAVHPHLDALRRTAGFYVSDSFYQTVLVLAQETTP
jgi:uncharacterized protein